MHTPVRSDGAYDASLASTSSRPGQGAASALAGAGTVVLRWLEDPVKTLAAPKLEALLWLLLIYPPIDFLVLASSVPSGSGAQMRAFLAAVGTTLALLLALRPDSRRLASGLTLGILIASFIWLFPGNSNHRFLVMVSLSVLVFLRLDDDNEAQMGVATLRWITLIVLFYTGLQKLLYGTYFRAEFLSWMVAHTERFGAALVPLVSAPEMARLQAVAGLPLAEQVYRTTAPALLAVSFGTWALEMSLPALLAWRRTRRIAVGAVVFFIALVQVAALEFSFGVVFVGLLLLFAEANWIRRLLPLFAVLLLAVLGSQLGWLPLRGLN